MALQIPLVAPASLTRSHPYSPDTNTKILPVSSSQGIKTPLYLLFSPLPTFHRLLILVPGTPTGHPHPNKTTVAIPGLVYTGVILLDMTTSLIPAFMISGLNLISTLPIPTSSMTPIMKLRLASLSGPAIFLTLTNSLKPSTSLMYLLLTSQVPCGRNFSLVSKQSTLRN